jgi:hypothetical protein
MRQSGGQDTQSMPGNMWHCFLRATKQPKQMNVNVGGNGGLCDDELAFARHAKYTIINTLLSVQSHTLPWRKVAAIVQRHGSNGLPLVKMVFRRSIRRLLLQCTRP